MVETQTTSKDLVEIIASHQYATVAAAAVQKKDYELAKGALERLVEDLKLGDNVRGFVEGSYTSPKGIETASMNYFSKFNEAFENCDVLNLRDYFLTYAPLKLGTILSPQEKLVFEARTDAYKNESLVKIRARVQSAKKIVQEARKSAGHPSNIITEAYKTMSLYGDVESIFMGLLEKNMSFMEHKAKEASNARSSDEIKQIALGF